MTLCNETFNIFLSDPFFFLEKTKRFILKEFCSHKDRTSKPLIAITKVFEQLREREGGADIVSLFILRAYFCMMLRYSDVNLVSLPI